MTARILVVDDIIANVKLLEARLTAEYFDVQSATSGADALDLLDRRPFDIVLLDVMMPGMDGFEVCRRIKANPKTTHVPVIMITALDQVADRVRGLEAGADDFLTKPVSDLALITRVRSLVRLKLLMDELSMRVLQGLPAHRDFGGAPSAGETPTGVHGRLLVVDDRRASFERILQALKSEHAVDLESVPQEALFRAAEGSYDLVVVSLSLADYDALRLCSQLRSLERTRLLPILLVSAPEDDARLLRGLDLGVNDYLVRPIDPQELKARVRTQIRRKRMADQLRDNVQLSIEMAVLDALTGLHNRRYLDRHLSQLVDHATERNRELSLLIIDIDHFKSVNDTYGHDAGDEVLREFARRLRKNVRGIDLACRFGGEEFVIVMPDTDRAVASLVAERLRERVAAEPFVIDDGERQLQITVSVGLAAVDRPEDTPEAVLKRADRALYQAKRDGRNRVVAAAA